MENSAIDAYDLYLVKCFVQLGEDNTSYKEFKVSSDASLAQVASDVELHPERYELCTAADVENCFVTLAAIVSEPATEELEVFSVSVSSIIDEDEDDVASELDEASDTSTVVVH